MVVAIILFLYWLCPGGQGSAECGPAALRWINDRGDFRAMIVLVTHETGKRRWTFLGQRSGCG
jgi:hypothetical protein